MASPTRLAIVTSVCLTIHTEGQAPILCALFAVAALAAALPLRRLDAIVPWPSQSARHVHERRQGSLDPALAPAEHWATEELNAAK
jgi:hypothetical protein